MPKYYTTGAYKLLSRYGGAESLVETTEYTIKIDPVSEWPYVREGIHKDEGSVVNDSRLIARLKQSSFPHLKGLYRVPENGANFLRPKNPEEPNKVAQGKIFPTWFFCPKCRRLRQIRIWQAKWSEVSNIQSQANDFSAQCGWCKEKENSRRMTGFELQQINFVVASKSGYLADVPWESYITGVGRANIAEGEDHEPGERERAVLNHLAGPCCQNQDLRYIVSKYSSDLQGISIKCDSCNNPPRSLSNLFSIRVSGGNERYPNRVFTKSTNSLYQPLAIQSLTLPSKEIFDAVQIEVLRTLSVTKNWVLIRGTMLGLKPNLTESEIETEMGKLGYSNNGPTQELDEVGYRSSEFRYLIDFKVGDQSSNESAVLRLKKYSPELLSQFAISNVLALRSLKLITVQIGYTRLETSSPDQYLLTDTANEATVVRKYITRFGQNEHYLPAVESFGEGIFLAFDSEKIKQWADEILTGEETAEGLTEMLDRARQSVFFRTLNFHDQSHLAKFLLLHTISHLLIKELEFLCGYPSASMHERIYCDAGDMAGILIYAMAGAEGTYGGLVSQAAPESLKKILESALWRAKDCSSDPVCYHNHHQGVEGLNSSSCYACTLLPETACDHLNGLLDRRLVVDKDFGFFRRMLYFGS